MIDFPASPTTGQLFNASNGVTYRYNGTVWLSEPSLGTGYGPTGDFCATGSASGSGAMATMIPATVVSGNLGGWYSTSTGLYRPPPGRYFIYGSITVKYSGGAITVTSALRKNGVQITFNTDTAAGANWSSDPAAVATVDANGSDVFDLYAGGIGAACTIDQIVFLAYPIAGAKGPPGDKGAPGVPASSNVWRQIGRVVPTAGQAIIDFTNIPADINDIELRYDLNPTISNAFLYLQTFDGAGAIQTSNNYVYFSTYTAHSHANGTQTYSYNGAPATVIPLNLNTTGWGPPSAYLGIQGRVTMNNIRDPTRGHSCQHDCIQLDSTAVNYAMLKGGGIQTLANAITGLRLYWSSGGSLARGAATLYGSP